MAGLLVLAAAAGLLAWGTLAAASGARNGGERAGAVGNLVGHGGPVKAVRISHDGKRALTGSFDYSMMVWDLEQEPPKLALRFPEHDAAVNVVRFLPGETRALTAGDDGIIRIWDLATGTLVRRLDGHTAKIVDVALTDDGRTAASASWDRSVRLWDLTSGKPGPVIKGHTSPVNAVAFTEGGDGRILTGGYDGTIRLWERDGTPVRTVYSHGWGINRLAVLPDPNLVLFGALNGTAGVVDVAAGEIRKDLKPHEGPVLAIALTPDRGLAATGGGDGAIHLWSTQDWELKEEYTNPYGPVWGLAFAPGGERLYYCGLDDFVTMWQVKPRQGFEEVANPFPRRFQASADMSLGERQFARKCSICHTLKAGDANRAGPSLFKVFGRKAGTLPGYAYSDALKKSDIVWSERTIEDLFALGPQHLTPGTKMPLQKMTDAKEREALIAFLKSATEGADGEQQPAPPSKEQ